MSTISLSDFEIEMLNKLMHTQAFVDYTILANGLRSQVREHKDAAIKNGDTTEQDYPSFENKTVADITQFLVHNEFFAEREGRVFFLTEKGNQLKTQGSLQKYLEWEMKREAQLMTDLHTIETKGYLDKDQTYTPAARPPDKDYRSRLFWYLIIILAIFLLWRYGKTIF